MESDWFSNEQTYIFSICYNPYELKVSGEIYLESCGLGVAALNMVGEAWVNNFCDIRSYVSAQTRKLVSDNMNKLTRLKKHYYITVSF